MSELTPASLQLKQSATPEQAAAILAAIGALLAEEAATVQPAPVLQGWAVAARVESLGIVRRIPGMLDLRYMGAPTRERLTRRP